MAQWSTRRKTLYAGIVFAILFGAILLPAYLFFYKAPTCTDGLMNQGETGVDCGGDCPRICSTAYVPPEIVWARADQIGSGVYNLGAYVKNLNLLGAVRNAPYVFSVYDKEGHLIAERKGTMTIPPHKNTVAFERAVATNKSIPFKVTFAFTNDLSWDKAVPTDDVLVVTDRQYSSDNTGASLQATVENRGLVTTKNVKVQGVLYDVSGNVVGFSETMIDAITRQSKEFVAFTWREYGKRDVATTEIIPILPPKYDK